MDSNDILRTLTSLKKFTKRNFGDHFDDIFNSRMVYDQHLQN